MIRLILNGVECTNSPNGLQDLIESYGWNDDFMLFIREMSGTIECFGDDFDYLYGLLKNDPCTVLPIELQEYSNGQYNQIYTGQLFMTDIEFDADNRIARFELTDDNFAGLINNNSDINIPFALARTKYGQVNAALVLNTISFNNFANTQVYSNSAATLYSCLDYAAYFCSNGMVRFYSDYLQNNSDLNYYYLLSGKSIRLNEVGSQINTITTRDLYRDITRIFGLIGIVEKQTDGTYRMRYEDFTYWRNLGQGGIVEKFKDVKVRTNKDQFFQAVRLGSAQSLEQQPVIGWMQLDDFATVSDCNSKDVLDYQSQKIVYDGYVIDDILSNGTDQYDMNVFLAHNFVDGQAYPSTTSIGGVAQPILNGSITNLQRANRLRSKYCLDLPLYRGNCEESYETVNGVGGNRAVFPTIDPTSPFRPNGSLIKVVGDTSIPPSSGNCQMLNYVNNFVDINFYLPNQYYPSPDGTNPTAYSFEYDITIEARFTNLIFGWALSYLTPPAPTYIPIINNQDTSIFTNVNPIGNLTGYCQYVSKSGVTVGDQFNVKGRIDFIYSTLPFTADLNYQFMGISFYSTINENVNIVPGGSIKIYPTINALNLIDQCQPYNYELQANGHISPNDMAYYRANPLNLYTIGHSLNNYTGQVQSLKRNVLSGQTDITLNTINV